MALSMAVVNIRMLGPCAGEQGQSWTLGPFTSSFRLLKIRIWYDNVVFGIQFRYELNDKYKWSPIFGENEGSFEEIPLDSALTQIKVSTGADNTHVSSLTFVTENGTIYGPYGDVSETKSDIPIQGIVAGFYGTDGNQVNSIGVYTVTP